MDDNKANKKNVIVPNYLMFLVAKYKSPYQRTGSVADATEAGG